MGSPIYEVGIRLNVESAGIARGAKDALTNLGAVEKQAAITAEAAQRMQNVYSDHTALDRYTEEFIKDAKGRGIASMAEAQQFVDAINLGKTKFEELGFIQQQQIKNVERMFEAIRRTGQIPTEIPIESLDRIHRSLNLMHHGTKNIGVGFQVMSHAAGEVKSQVVGIFGALTSASPAAKKLLEPFEAIGRIVSPLTEQLKKAFTQKILQSFAGDLKMLDDSFKNFMDVLTSPKKTTPAFSFDALVPAGNTGVAGDEAEKAMQSMANNITKNLEKLPEVAKKAMGDVGKNVTQTASQVGSASESVSGNLNNATKSLKTLSSATSGSAEAAGTLENAMAATSEGLVATSGAASEAGVAVTAAGGAAGGGGAGGFIALGGAAAAAAGPLIIIVALIGAVVAGLWFMKLGFEGCAKAAEEFKTVNYRATGSVKELTLATADLQAHLGATDEQAVATVKSLSHVGYTVEALNRAVADSHGQFSNASEALKELARQNYTFSTATGVAAETTARFQKVLSNAGMSGEAQHVMLGKLILASEEYGLTNQDLASTMDTVNSVSIMLNNTFGKAGLETIPQLTVGMMQLASSAKQLGVDVSTINGVVAEMNKHPIKFAILLGEAMSGTPQERLEAFGKSAADAMEELKYIDPMIQYDYAMKRFGTSMEVLAVAADQYNAKLKDPTIQKKFENEKAAAEAFDKSMTSLSQSFGKIWGAIKGAAMKFIQPIFDEISKALDAISPYMEDFINIMVEGFKFAFVVLNPIVITFRLIYNLLRSLFSLLGDLGFGTAIKKAFEWVSWVLTKLNEAITAITTLGGLIGGGDDDKLNKQKEINKALDETAAKEEAAKAKAQVVKGMGGWNPDQKAYYEGIQDNLKKVAEAKWRELNPGKAYPVTQTALAATQADQPIEVAVAEGGPKSTATNDTTAMAQAVIDNTVVGTAVDRVAGEAITDAKVKVAKAEPKNQTEATDRLTHNKTIEEQNKQLIAELKTLIEKVSEIADSVEDRDVIRSISHVLQRFLPKIAEDDKAPFPGADLQKYAGNNSWQPPR